MRFIAFLSVSVLGTILRGAEPANGVTATSLSALNGGATVVDVMGEEAQANAPFPIRFAFGHDSVGVTVKNTTPSPITPTLSFEFFNSSGMLVCAVEASFANEVIPVGEVRVRQVTLSYPEIEKIFRNSSIKLPDDWKRIRFAKVVNNGTPLAAANPAARARPMVLKQQNIRPAIFAENKFGTANIGPIAIDAKWSNYGAYLQRLIDSVQTQWERLLIESRIYPPSGTTVEVKFIIDSEGKISQIVNVDNKSSEQAARACVSAITDRAPYGQWTDDMKAALGDKQEITFKFFYQ
jgi:hypothetical protein